MEEKVKVFSHNVDVEETPDGGAIITIRGDLARDLRRRADTLEMGVEDLVVDAIETEMLNRLENGPWPATQSQIEPAKGTESKLLSANDARKIAEEFRSPLVEKYLLKALEYVKESAEKGCTTVYLGFDDLSDDYVEVSNYMLDYLLDCLEGLGYSASLDGDYIEISWE
jgi:hypothetical protein